MGGRPEQQYQRPLDEHIATENKQHERQTEKEDDLRRVMSADSKKGDEDAGDLRRVMNSDEKIDEASEESFPASDPPQQP